MVEPLKSLALRMLPLALCAVPAAHASDENLPDPTRPPAFLSAPAAGKDGASDGSPPAAVIQAIKYGPRYQAVIIDGQEIPLGGRYGDARVVAITPSEIVLRNGKDKQVLKLFPDAEKKAAPAAQTQVLRKKST